MQNEQISKNETEKILENLIEHFSKYKSDYENFLELQNQISSKGKILSTSFMAGIMLFLSGIFLTRKGLVPDSAGLYITIPAGLIIIGGFLYSRSSRKNLVAQKEETVQKLFAAWSSFENCPLRLEYTFPDTLQKLLDYIKSGKSSTLDEAVSRFNEEETDQLIIQSKISLKEINK